MLEVYYWSMEQRDRARLPSTGWLAYLQGNDPGYPVRTLEQDFATIRRKVREMRDNASTPDNRLSDDSMPYNPATVETLVQLMLGGLHPGHQGSVLHCRLRYFDPLARRACRTTSRSWSTR